MVAKSQKLAAFGIFWILILGVGGFIMFYNPNPIDTLPNFGSAADFTMPDYNGENFTLSSTDGEVRVLTFIYTNCPDGCAVISSKMADLREKLQEEELYGDTQFVTVDFDYKYDNRSDLKQYAQNYLESGDDWEFLLGNENQTMNVTDAYNFPFSSTNTSLNTSTIQNTVLQPNHSNHTHEGVVYSHPFVVYFIDQKRDIRSMKGGLTWDIQNAVYIVDFLLNN